MKYTYIRATRRQKQKKEGEVLFYLSKKLTFLNISKIFFNIAILKKIVKKREWRSG